jgi:hypothetical protein
MNEKAKRKVHTHNPQYRALKQFFLSLGGSGWRRKDNWLSKHPVNMWYGIKANSSGKVVSIELNNNLLSGKLPNAITNFDKLAILSLQDNNIAGQVPVTLVHTTSSLSLTPLPSSSQVPVTLVHLRRIRMMNFLGNPGLRMDQVS